MWQWCKPCSVCQMILFVVSMGTLFKQYKNQYNYKKVKQHDNIFCQPFSVIIQFIQNCSITIFQNEMKSAISFVNFNQLSNVWMLQHLFKLNICKLKAIWNISTYMLTLIDLTSRSPIFLTCKSSSDSRNFFSVTICQSETLKVLEYGTDKSTDEINAKWSYWKIHWHKFSSSDFYLLALFYLNEWAKRASGLEK